MDKQLTREEQFHRVIEVGVECRNLLLDGLLLCSFAKYRVAKSARDSRNELIRDLAEWLCRVFRKVLATDTAINPVRVLFVGALDHPCMVAGEPCPSYHEGVLSYLHNELLKAPLDFNDPFWQVVYATPWLSIRENEQESLIRNEQKRPNYTDCRSVQKYLKESPTEIDRLAHLEVPFLDLRTALDKETVRIQLQLSAWLNSSIGAPDATSRRWSPPLPNSVIAGLFKCSKNTVTSRMKKLQKDGKAQKVGKTWQIALEAMPHSFKP